MRCTKTRNIPPKQEARPKPLNESTSSSRYQAHRKQAEQKNPSPQTKETRQFHVYPLDPPPAVNMSIAVTAIRDQSRSFISVAPRAAVGATYPRESASGRPRLRSIAALVIVTQLLRMMPVRPWCRRVCSVGVRPRRWSRSLRGTNLHLNIISVLSGDLWACRSGDVVPALPTAVFMQACTGVLWVSWRP